MGICCGLVGRAVAAYTSDPRFESSQCQFYSLLTALKTCFGKLKLKKRVSNFYKIKTKIALQAQLGDAKYFFINSQQTSLLMGRC